MERQASQSFVVGIPSSLSRNQSSLRISSEFLPGYTVYSENTQVRSNQPACTHVRSEPHDQVGPEDTHFCTVTWIPSRTKAALLAFFCVHPRYEARGAEVGAEVGHGAVHLPLLALITLRVDANWSHPRMLLRPDPTAASGAGAAGAKLVEGLGFRV
eukprot:3161761-Rhodomonas_salina.2